MANPRESLFSGYSNNYSVLSDGDRGNGEFQYQTSNRISAPKDAGIQNARVSYETFTKADGEPNGWRVSGEFGPARARYGQDVNGSGTFEVGAGVSGVTACRSKLGDFGAMCPFRLVNQIFDNHSYLKSLEVN